MTTVRDGFVKAASTMGGSGGGFSSSLTNDMRTLSHRAVAGAPTLLT